MILTWYNILLINVKKILAVNNATYAVAKRKPEKNQACRDSNPDLCDTGAEVRGQGSNPGKPDFFFQAFFSQLHKLRY